MTRTTTPPPVEFNFAQHLINAMLRAPAKPP